MWHTHTISQQLWGHTLSWTLSTFGLNIRVSVTGCRQRHTPQSFTCTRSLFPPLPPTFTQNMFMFVRRDSQTKTLIHVLIKAYFLIWGHSAGMEMTDAAFHAFHSYSLVFSLKARFSLHFWNYLYKTKHLCYSFDLKPRFAHRVDAVLLIHIARLTFISSCADFFKYLTWWKVFKRDFSPFKWTTLEFLNTISHFFSHQIRRQQHVLT